MTTTDKASRKVQRYYIERWTYITEYFPEEPAVNGTWLERELCGGGGGRVAAVSHFQPF